MATRSLNKVMLIGNLTRDPELRYTTSGTPVATFTVATNRNFTDSSGTQKETAEFTSVVAWAKLAEICSQLLAKGTKVYVEGRLQSSTWQDKETGKNQKRTEVVITDMIILSGSKSNQHSASTEESETSSIPAEVLEEVDASEIDLGADAVDFNSLSDDDSKDNHDKGSSDNKKVPF